MWKTYGAYYSYKCAGNAMRGQTQYIFVKTTDACKAQHESAADLCTRLYFVGSMHPISFQECINPMTIFPELPDHLQRALLSISEKYRHKNFEQNLLLDSR